MASVSLRLLIGDGLLIRAWKAFGIGGPVEVEAPRFETHPGDRAIAFCGGADLLPGIPVSMSWFPEGETEVALITKKFHLDPYLSLPCAYLSGIRVSPHDLVKYIANTKGGAHYDPGGKSKGSRSAKFNALRDAEQNGFGGVHIACNGRNLVHHEIASIIKSMLESKQIRRLQQELLN